MCRLVNQQGQRTDMLRILYLLLFGTIVVFSAGCASTGGDTIEIDMRQVAGRQHMPDELSDMLGDLGYDWVPIPDPYSQLAVKTVQQDDEYRMLFEHSAGGQVRIDVRIRQKDGFTHLHFYEPASQTLSESSMVLLRELQQRVALEFGAANVSY
jgi:hypothetical protein